MHHKNIEIVQKSEGIMSLQHPMDIFRTQETSKFFFLFKKQQCPSKNVWHFCQFVDWLKSLRCYDKMIKSMWCSKLTNSMFGWGYFRKSSNKGSFLQSEPCKDRGLTFGGENSLGKDTVSWHTAPVVEHKWYPVTQSKDWHRREVKPGHNFLFSAQTWRKMDDFSFQTVKSLQLASHQCVGAKMQKKKCPE